MFTTETMNPFFGRYTVTRIKESESGMEFLRSLFPTGKADDLNFVLFSTSGVHGTYTTIEDLENPDPQESRELTFLVIHQRILALKYGNAIPRSPEDFAFLKCLRASSHDLLPKIGK